MLNAEDFFDLDGFEYADVFDDCEFVWSVLAKVGTYALHHIMNMPPGEKHIRGVVMEGAYIDDENAVVIGEGTVVEPGAFIQGPAIIGRNCQIRNGAYIRGDIIIGDDCVVGHSTELKNVIMLPTAQCAHFAYVGDSILGRDTNLGAGTKLSNLPIVSTKDSVTKKRPSIKLQINGITYDTKLGKFGAVIGDGAQTGCNTTLNPGCLVGKNTLIYPNIALKKGYYASNKVVKLMQQTEVISRNLH